jgi:hypothetical protein
LWKDNFAKFAKTVPKTTHLGNRMSESPRLRRTRLRQ